MVAYLFHVGGWALWLLLGVPLVYVGTFYALVTVAGMPPGVLDVWGLAVVLGSLLLLPLKALLWVVWKARGSPPPRPPPEPPRWARVVFQGGLGLSGVVGGLGVCFGALAFITVGNWPGLGPEGEVYLGDVVVESRGELGGWRADFVPRGRYTQQPAKDVPLPDAELIAAEVCVLELEGPVAQVLGRIGVTSAALPWRLHRKIDPEAEPGGVQDLVPRSDILLNQVLEGLRLLPGVTVRHVFTEYTPLERPRRLGLRAGADGARFVAPEGAPPEPEPEDPVGGPPAPTREPPAPTEEPPPSELPGPDEPAEEDPRPVELAMDEPPPLELYPGDPRVPGSPGDPFEGLD